MAPYDAWVGREQRASDCLHPALAARFLATFDLPGGGPIPQGIHFCLAPPQVPTGSLGEDGHPRRDAGETSFLPPIPLPRRMWAGSTISFHRAIAVGDPVERKSRIVGITQKTGGTGPLVFVEIDHATTAGGFLAVEERQTLVYRDAAMPDAGLTPPPAARARGFDRDGWDAHRTVVPDAPLLFRYSALTFNSHRIHYDLPYARDVERYRGLVVHGPLNASLLLQLAGAQIGDNRLARFAFRALSAAIAGEPLHLVMRGRGNDLAMAAFADDGRQVVAATGTLA